jgi:hypothetical protein
MCISKHPMIPAPKSTIFSLLFGFFENTQTLRATQREKKTHHFDAQAILVMRRIPSARKTIQGPCRVFSRSHCEFRRHDEKDKNKKKRKETEGRVYIPRNQQLRSGEVDRCT